ncbi:PREDICTED: uncharacterized protein At3g43530-like [Camelina sativa]|uniref:Uncharacterized protein At3g43530-like n=1 Tax=Camelina sativa TaxID=90675 RepID=A0ABM1Q772_CAMSA|nr:PREDICTED: uncharacterized protein At3g43530-like [Camelina sativa]
MSYTRFTDSDEETKALQPLDMFFKPSEFMKPFKISANYIHRAVRLIVYEAIPALKNNFLKSVREANPEFSRMCKSKFKQSHLKSFPMSDLYDTLSTTMEIQSIMVPFPDEKVLMKKVMDDECGWKDVDDAIEDGWTKRIVKEKKPIFFENMHKADVASRAVEANPDGGNLAQENIGQMKQGWKKVAPTKVALKKMTAKFDTLDTRLKIVEVNVKQLKEAKKVVKATKNVAYCVDVGEEEEVVEFEGIVEEEEVVEDEEVAELDCEGTKNLVVGDNRKEVGEEDVASRAVEANPDGGNLAQENIGQMKQGWKKVAPTKVALKKLKEAKKVVKATKNVAYCVDVGEDEEVVEFEGIAEEEEVVEDEEVAELDCEGTKNLVVGDNRKEFEKLGTTGVVFVL